MSKIITFYRFGVIDFISSLEFSKCANAVQIAQICISVKIWIGRVCIVVLSCCFPPLSTFILGSYFQAHWTCIRFPAHFLHALFTRHFQSHYASFVHTLCIVFYIYNKLGQQYRQYTNIANVHNANSCTTATKSSVINANLKHFTCGQANSNNNNNDVDCVFGGIRGKTRIDFAQCLPCSDSVFVALFSLGSVFSCNY